MFIFWLRFEPKKIPWSQINLHRDFCIWCISVLQNKENKYIHTHKELVYLQTLTCSGLISCKNMISVSWNECFTKINTISTSFFYHFIIFAKKVKRRACTKKKIYFIYLLSTHTVCQKQKAYKNSIGHEF